VGYNKSSGQSDAAWVNNQTSITGTNSVMVNAGTLEENKIFKKRSGNGLKSKAVL
jgi:hypothetical protein